MDPNVTLSQLQACAEWESRRSSTEDGYAVAENAGQMADLFDALDGWLRRGGFRPAAWKRQRTARPDHDFSQTRWATIQSTLRAKLGMSEDLVETSIGEVLHALSEAGYQITHPDDDDARVVYVVQRENFDGLYGFEDEEQAKKYAELFQWQGAAPVDTGTLNVLDVNEGADLIEETKLEMAED